MSTLSVEIFGISRTGKTSTLLGLVSHFEKSGESCEVIARPPIDFKSCASLEDFHDKILSYLETNIPRLKGGKPRYLLMDRGPYDREVMLDADYMDSQIGRGFYVEAKERLARLQTGIDLPLMFLITPETSLARIGTQRDEGLDYSHLCVGLNTRDTLEGLGQLYAKYVAFQKEKPKINEIHVTGNLDGTIHAVLKRIELKKIKNGGNLSGQ
jgi:thymidylate kinase